MVKNLTENLDGFGIPLAEDTNGKDLYSIWFDAREKIQAAVDLAEIELKRISGDNNGKLTPDSIKSTDEYKKAKANFDKSFQILRKFNGQSPKEFMRRASKRGGS